MIKPEGTYPIPIHEVISYQSSHFYNMNLFYRLLVHINHPSIKSPFHQKAPGSICVVLHSLLIKEFVKMGFYESFVINVAL